MPEIINVSFVYPDRDIRVIDNIFTSHILTVQTEDMYPETWNALGTAFKMEFFNNDLVIVDSQKLFIKNPVALKWNQDDSWKLGLLPSFFLYRPSFHLLESDPRNFIVKAYPTEIIPEEPEEPPFEPVYLSDLNWVSATSRYGILKKDLNFNGTPIVIGGTTYSKGIGVFAPSVVLYDIPEGATRLKASVGIDWANRNSGNVAIFRVVLDSTEKYNSGPINANRNAIDMDISLSGGSQVTLICDEGADGPDSDWGNWAEARFE